MGEAPERKTTVPEQAVWVPDLDCWELAERNAEGQRSGERLLYRADGSLYVRSRYRSDVQEGPFFYYHPNGQIAREGTYVGGQRDGAVIAYGSDAPTRESLRSCCVPPGAWEMRAQFENGRLLREVFFNREGQRLLSNGRVRPDKPPGVPAAAEFEEYSNRWVLGGREPSSGHAQGLWQWWAEDGSLSEESDHRDGKKVRTRTYDAGGLREDVRFADEGVRDGEYFRRFATPHQGPYADPRIAAERGLYEREQRVGTWTWLDAGGRALVTVDRGLSADNEAIGRGVVFDDEERSAGVWAALARDLRRERRLRESLLATARAAAAAGDAALLRALLEEVTVPLAPDEGERQAKAVADLAGDKLAALLDALLGGVDPAAAFRALAVVTTAAPRAARDFAEAAVLLAPERTMTYVTRALVRIEMGDQPGALSDAERVAAESADAAGFIRDYLRVLFPEFSFWPANESPTTAIENMPDEPGQPLDAVRRLMGVYATRITLVRAAVQRLLARYHRADSAPTPAWLPPDLSPLLPEGPIQLKKEAAQILDETESGVETTDVQIDETLDLSEASFPALMRQARVDWQGLSWLCWSAGLDRIAVPDVLAPPPAFAAAATLAFTRCWRAQDSVSTGGLRSMTQGVPGFSWEGLEIDGVPQPLLQMALDEYREMRALFLWLASPENLSPFQNDLRQPMG